MQDQKICLAVQLALPSAGVVCNNVVPEWLRVVLLTALLLFVVYKTAKKGKRSGQISAMPSQSAMPCA